MRLGVAGIPTKNVPRVKAGTNRAFVVIDGRKAKKADHYKHFDLVLILPGCAHKTTWAIRKGAAQTKFVRSRTTSKIIEEIEKA